MEKEKLCAIFGENPDELEFGYDEEHHLCAQMKYKLVTAIRGLMVDGCNEFISTLEQGAAMWGAEACIAIKQLGGNVRLIAAPMSEKQCDRWHPERRERYYSIMESADMVIPPEGECFGETYILFAATHAVILGDIGKPRINDFAYRARMAGLVVVTA